MTLPPPRVLRCHVVALGDGAVVKVILLMGRGQRSRRVGSLYVDARVWASDMLPALRSSSHYTVEVTPTP